MGTYKYLLSAPFPLGVGCHNVPPFFCYQRKKPCNLKLKILCKLGYDITDHPHSAQLTINLIWSLSHKLKKVFSIPNLPPHTGYCVNNTLCVSKISGELCHGSGLTKSKLKCQIVSAVVHHFLRSLAWLPTNAVPTVEDVLPVDPISYVSYGDTSDNLECLKWHKAGMGEQLN